MRQFLYELVLSLAADMIGSAHFRRHLRAAWLDTLIVLRDVATLAVLKFDPHAPPPPGYMTDRRKWRGHAG